MIYGFSTTPSPVAQLPSCKWVNGQPYKVFFINNYWNVTCCVGRWEQGHPSDTQAQFWLQFWPSPEACVQLANLL